VQSFWPDSGAAYLTRNDNGWHRVSPDYIRFMLGKPELAPLPESDEHERSLHTRLLDDPLMPISGELLMSLTDPDTRGNYMHFLRWRKLVTDAVTLERFYLQMFRSGKIDIPPVFIDWAAQAIAHGIVNDAGDVVDSAYRARAAELFFRRQRVSTEQSRVLSADAETIQVFADTGGFGNVGRLFAQQGTPMRGVNMDVLSHENAQMYWFGEDRYRFVLDLTHGSVGLDALADLLARWVQHFFGLAVSVTPLPRIDDQSWRWHVGLDVESTAILNDLYEGNEVEEARLQRLIALFRLDFQDPTDMREDAAGKPVYLGLAINDEHLLKCKPQNLLLNLPLLVSS
jgi:hypothetical protein